MRYKKQCSVAVMLIVFGMVLLCFHNPVRAKQNMKMKTKNMILVTGDIKKLNVNVIKNLPLNRVVVFFNAAYTGAYSRYACHAHSVTYVSIRALVCVPTVAALYTRLRRLF